MIDHGDVGRWGADSAECHDVTRMLLNDASAPGLELLLGPLELVVPVTHLLRLHVKEDVVIFIGCCDTNNLGLHIPEQNLRNFF